MKRIVLLLTVLIFPTSGFIRAQDNHEKIKQDKLETPLLIHTNSNDDVVNVLEVEHLIQALKAAGKKFEYPIYKDVPGGHSFDRIGTQAAQGIRVKIYKFLAGYLHPENPIETVKQLKKAAYRF